MIVVPGCAFLLLILITLTTYGGGPKACSPCTLSNSSVIARTGAGTFAIACGHARSGLGALRIGLGSAGDFSIVFSANYSSVSVSGLRLTSLVGSNAFRRDSVVNARISIVTSKQRVRRPILGVHDIALASASNHRRALRSVRTAITSGLSTPVLVNSTIVSGFTAEDCAISARGGAVAFG